jgi:hypothetical protein
VTRSIERELPGVVIRKDVGHPSLVAVSRDERMTRLGPVACKVTR